MHPGRQFLVFIKNQIILCILGDSFLCYLNFYRTQVSLGSDLWVRLSLTQRGFANLADVTPAMKIPTDTANKAIQGNVAMQVTKPGGQLIS